MQESAILFCGICYREYNTDEQEARIIPSCGHSLCKKCILGILENSAHFTCPFDRRPFHCQPISIDNFPLNYAIQEYIGGETGYEICDEHNLKKKLICYQDRIMVCEECVYNGEHPGHKIYPIRKARAIAQERHDQYKGSLDKINEWRNRMCQLFDEEDLIAENIRQVFNRFHMTLKAKEEELLRNIKIFLEGEKKKVGPSMEYYSSLMMSFQQKVNNLQDVLEGKDIMKFVKEIESYNLNLNDHSLYDQLDELNFKIGNLKEFIQFVDSKYIEIINSMDFSMDQSVSDEGEEMLSHYDCPSKKYKKTSTSSKLRDLSNIPRDNLLKGKNLRSSKDPENTYFEMDRPIFTFEELLAQTLETYPYPQLRK